MSTAARITLQSAEPQHAPKLHALITANLDEGRLLPRTLQELTLHAERFVIAVCGPTIVGCAELAPLGPHLAEIRSLAVDRGMRTAGIGARIIGELQRRARREGFEQLCAFTHSPAYFMRLGFSIVPHLSLPEKVLADCAGCGLFRQCGKYAVVAPIAAVREPSAEAFEPATAAATGLSA